MCPSVSMCMYVHIAYRNKLYGDTQRRESTGIWGLGKTPAGDPFGCWILLMGV